MSSLSFAVHEFVTLAAALRNRRTVTPCDTEEDARASDAEAAKDERTAATQALCTEFGAGIALARCAALEAYDRAVPRLLAALAADVLGRELWLAPADLRTIALRVRATFAEEEPVALFVARADALPDDLGPPVRVDRSLEPGDLIVEVRDGELDARLRVRLAAALSAVLDAG